MIISVFMVSEVLSQKTPAEARGVEAKRILDNLVKENKESIIEMAKERIGKSLVLESLSIRALVTIGPKVKQGAEARVYEMSVASKLHLIGHIIGINNVTFDTTIGGLKATFMAKVFILKKVS